MAILVKITSLQRGKSVEADGSVGASRGFRVKSALGRQYDNGTAASVTVGASNAAVTYAANFKGAAGDNIKVAHVISGDNTPLSVVTTYAAGTANPTITVNAATDGSGVATTTAAQAAAAVNADFNAAQYVTATAGGTGASAITAQSAEALAGGADSGTDAEPPYDVAGEPVWLNVTNKNIVVVDVTDQQVARTLERNAYRVVWLGQP